MRVTRVRVLGGGLVEHPPDGRPGGGFLGEGAIAEGPVLHRVHLHDLGEEGLAPIEAIDEEEYDRVFAVNVKAPFFLVKQGAERMRDGGRVINISSGLARTAAMPHNMAYAMTKGALDVFSRDLSKILGARGIRVNSVAPGLIDTDNTAGFLHGTEGGWAQAEAYSALGQVGTAADVADVVAFLASDDGRWVTGSWVDATGGSMP